MDNSGTTNVKTEFSATNSAINLKQNQINFLTNLTCATLDCSNLNIGGESIDTKIANSTGSTITQADLDLKQNILTYNNDLVSNSIVVKPRFTQEVYTEALDGEIRASILSIEDQFSGETINVKDTLAGLQTTLDITAKLDSVNTFTANQTVVGDLKGDYVLVKNTTPTLTTHVTSKLNVDTAVNKKTEYFNVS